MFKLITYDGQSSILDFLVSVKKIINNAYLNRFGIAEGSAGDFMCLAKFTFVASLPICALMHGFEAFIIRETTKDFIPKIVKYLMIQHCHALIQTESGFVFI